MACLHLSVRVPACSFAGLTTCLPHLHVLVSSGLECRVMSLVPSCAGRGLTRTASRTASPECPGAHRSRGSPEARPPARPQGQGAPAQSDHLLQDTASLSRH